MSEQIHMDGEAYRKLKLDHFSPFSQKQRPVAEFFTFNWENDAVERWVGDRKFVVPRGGLLFSRNRVAALLDVSEGTVIDVLTKLKKREMVKVYNAMSEEPFPRVHQPPRRAGDRSEDRSRDRFYSVDHRGTPSMLVWQNLFGTFGVLGDGPELAARERDRRNDQRGDRRGDRSDRQNLLKIV